MAAPTYTAGSAGNVITSASIAAAGSSNASVDYSTKLEAQIHVKNTPGGSVSTTRGLKVEVFRRYGSGPTTGETPLLTFTLPSTTASTAESLDFYLGPGKYNIKLTNLDAANAVTAEVTADTVDSIA